MITIEDATMYAWRRTTMRMLGYIPLKDYAVAFDELYEDEILRLIELDRQGGSIPDLI